MRAWVPGSLICDDVDEYYEPLDKKDRILAAKMTLTIRLAMHRAAELQKQGLYTQRWGRAKRPTQQPE